MQEPGTLAEWNDSAHLTMAGCCFTSLWDSFFDLDKMPKCFWEFPWVEYALVPKISVQADDEWYNLFFSPDICDHEI